MNTEIKSKYKHVRIFERDHREIKIEVARAGLTIEEMISRLLDNFIQKRQADDHKKDGTGGEQPV